MIIDETYHCEKMLRLNVDPHSVPALRKELVDAYATQFINERDGFDTITEFCRQIGLNTGDKKIVGEIKNRIAERGLRRAA